MRQLRPEIIIVQVGDKYGIECHGRYGGGYSIPPTKTEEEAVAILARDARRYDCGEGPILIVAPERIKALAGLSHPRRGG